MREPALIQYANFEDSGATLMARVKLESGYMLQADISAISIKCSEKGAPATVTGDTTPAVADVVYDALQSGWPWETDEAGYNFRYAAPASFFPDGAKNYLVEIKFTRAAGGDFHIVFDQETIDLQRS